MHVCGQAHFGDEREVRAGNASGVGLFEGQLEVRGFHGFGDFLAQFREQFGNDAIAREALAVAGLKNFSRMMPLG